jgi:hypothetical protein
MSDTPETDALVPRFLTGGEIPDLFAFCRKLEIERNEARRQCSQWLQEWVSYADYQKVHNAASRLLVAINKQLPACQVFRPTSKAGVGFR